jgi:hypothetical protein
MMDGGDDGIGYEAGGFLGVSAALAGGTERWSGLRGFAEQTSCFIQRLLTGCVAQVEGGRAGLSSACRALEQSLAFEHSRRVEDRPPYLHGSSATRLYVVSYNK